MTETCFDIYCANCPWKPEKRGRGLQPKVWGPAGWFFFHSTTFGYPLEPTEEQKRIYNHFYHSFAQILPCPTCRTDFTQYLNLNPPVLSSREALIEWGYLAHKFVSNKLGAKYDISLADLIKRFESIRAVEENTNYALDYSIKKEHFGLDSGCPMTSWWGILIMVILVLSVGAMAIVASKQKSKSAFGNGKTNLCLAISVPLSLIACGLGIWSIIEAKNQ